MAERDRGHVIDEQTFRTLYPRLRRLASVVRPPEADPDDLVQDALVRVLKNRELSQLTHPEAYLCRVIVSIASDHRRSWSIGRQAWSRLGRPATSTWERYPSDLGDLHSLPPEDRAVLYLHEVEGLSYREIAKLLDLTEAAARKRASRARRVVRASLTLEMRS